MQQGAPKGQALPPSAGECRREHALASDEAAALTEAGAEEAERLLAEARTEADARLRKAHEIKELAVVAADELQDQARRLRAEAPDFIRGSALSNWNVTSNCRVVPADSKNPLRFARPDSAPTFAGNFSAASESISTTAACPSLRLARSFSSTLARTSIRPDSITSATGRPGQTVSPSRYSGIAMP